MIPEKWNYPPPYLFSVYLKTGMTAVMQISN